MWIPLIPLGHAPAAKPMPKNLAAKRCKILQGMGMYSRVPIWSCSLESLGWLVVIARWPAPLLSWAALPRWQQATVDILHCTSFVFTLPLESSGCGDRLKLVLSHGNTRQGFPQLSRSQYSSFSNFEHVLITCGHLVSPCHLCLSNTSQPDKLSQLATELI